MVHSRGSLSGLQRWKRVACRKRFPSNWSYDTSTTTPGRTGVQSRFLPADQRLSAGHPDSLPERAVRGELTETPEQLLTIGVAETGTVTDEGELAVVVVEAEEEGADLASVLVLPEAPDHHVDRAPVLDLDHRSLARLVGAVELLGDDPVAPSRLVFVEPPPRRVLVGGRRREVPRMLQALGQLHQPLAALAERKRPKVFSSQRQDVERHELGRRLRGQLLDPRLRRVDALLQHVELGDVVDHHHDLAVDHRPLRQLTQGRLELREVPEEGTLVAGVEPDLGF